MTGGAGQWVTLGRVMRSRGLAGEVIVTAFGVGLDVFTGLQKSGRKPTLFGASLQPAGVSLALEKAWLHQDRLILKFAGISSITEAEQLQGAEIRLLQSELAPPEAGEYYLKDLLGLRVVDCARQEEVGRVAGWRDTGGQHLLEVKTASGVEILVPFVKSICVEIDVAGGKILADLPEGLRELNRE
ncbi:MAG: 16S rRNA processing protein RimM [Acidobacteriia bacterium]|nr:16S rRNA processing protein RimM [Terriglobia bacterium]